MVLVFFMDKMVDTTKIDVLRAESESLYQTVDLLHSYAPLTITH